MTLAVSVSLILIGLGLSSADDSSNYVDPTSSIASEGYQPPQNDQFLQSQGFMQPNGYYPVQGYDFPVAYDAVALAAMNGRPPPYQAFYPTTESGYLVPVYVDESVPLPTSQQYEWVDPAQVDEVLTKSAAPPPQWAVAAFAPQIPQE